MKHPLCLGTRASPLALWQANHVAALLRSVEPGIAIEFLKITTTGDQVRDRPLAQIGGEGLFTKQIQRAVLDRQADVAVHSLKDLPTFDVTGLTLAAVPARGPTGDAFVSKRHASFDALPRGAVVATGSLRRKSQLLYRRPDLRLVDIRGNVETRLRALTEDNLDGMILAEAGLARLGLTEHITEILDNQWMLPAVGQGALGLECRTGAECRGDDEVIFTIVQKLDHPPTSCAARAERAMLKGLGGGCQVPIGASTTVHGDTLQLRGVVLSPDGSRRVLREISGPLPTAVELGQQLAENLLADGARELLEVN